MIKFKIKLFRYPILAYIAIKEIKKYNPKILNNYLNIINLYLIDPDNSLFSSGHNPSVLHSEYLMGSYEAILTSHFLFFKTKEGETFWDTEVKTLLRKKHEFTD